MTTHTNGRPPGPRAGSYTTWRDAIRNWLANLDLHSRSTSMKGAATESGWNSGCSNTWHQWQHPSLNLVWQFNCIARNYRYFITCEDKWKLPSLPDAFETEVDVCQLNRAFDAEDIPGTKSVSYWLGNMVDEKHYF